MKTNRKAPDAPPAQGDDAGKRGRRRRIDSLDQPARPLGAKRAALQLRRKRQAGSPNRRTTAQGHGCLCTLTSQDESVTFTLHTTSEGLLVERTQKHVTGIRLTQSMVFADQPAFDRWCSAEPLRFDDAVLFGQLVREGHGAFSQPG